MLPYPVKIHRLACKQSKDEIAFVVRDTDQLCGFAVCNEYDLDTFYNGEKAIAAYSDGQLEDVGN